MAGYHKQRSSRVRFKTSDAVLRETIVNICTPVNGEGTCSSVCRTSSLSYNMTHGRLGKQDSPSLDLTHTGALYTHEKTRRGLPREL